MVLQNPHVTLPVTVRIVESCAVVAGHDLVTVAGREILDEPGVGPLKAIELSFSSDWGWLPPCAFNYGEDAVLIRRVDIEIESPVDVMMMDGADATAGGRAEAVARANRAVRIEPPLVYVTIPTSVQLRDEDQLRALRVNGHALKVARVVARFKGRGGRALNYPKARADVAKADRVRLEVAFRILPVAIRAAGIGVVFDVEDRNMRALQDHLAAILHVL